MAKLDQSFIKAYGHVGIRPSAAPNAAPASPEPAAASGLPLISAAPIVVDAGSFAFDTCSAPSMHNAPKHRAETAPAANTSAAPRPHIDASSPTEAAAPRKPRRAPVKRAATAAGSNQPAITPLPAFQADSFSVDTASAEMKPPISKPTAPAKPVETRRQPPRLTAGDLCHRACTVQFSTVADALIEASEDHADDLAEFEVPSEPALASFAPATTPSAPTQSFAGPNTASAPRIDGVAYRRMSAPASPPLRTGYEVDAFRWPEVVGGLGARATTALTTLIDELVDSSSIGRGVVMFAGERRGAGTTTLAAYAARRLAQLGLSVALVDADFAKPALARSLGVAVEYGWDDTLEAQTEPNAAMISSLADGVALLPLRHAAFGISTPRAARIAADLAILRQHFALVIVDGGPLAEVAEPWLAHAPEDAVDCGIVVRDARIDAARPANRPHVRTAATLPAIGIVENFVAESQTKPAKP